MQAADQNHSSAISKIGQSYMNGDFIKEIDIAISWWKRAAELNNSNAHFNLGKEKSFYWFLNEDWFLIAAKAGDADAQYCVAGAYRTGQGVNLDTTLGNEWLEQARENVYVDDSC